MTTTRNKLRIVLAVVIAGAVSIGAYAYWTAGGSGSGSGTAGDTTPLVVNQSTVLDAMYPGDSPQTLSGTFDNANDGPIRVNTVTASISAVTKAEGAPAGTCDATDFTLAGATMTVNAEVATGTAVGAWTGATIKFNNKASSQDACKGATVSLAYTIA